MLMGYMDFSSRASGNGGLHRLSRQVDDAILTRPPALPNATIYWDQLEKLILPKHWGNMLSPSCGICKVVNVRFGDVCAIRIWIWSSLGLKTTFFDGQIWIRNLQIWNLDPVWNPDLEIWEGV